MSATTIAAPRATSISRSEAIAPVRTIVSPRAMMMNSWKRSAKEGAVDVPVARVRPPHHRDPVARVGAGVVQDQSGDPDGHLTGCRQGGPDDEERARGHRQIAMRANDARSPEPGGLTTTMNALRITWTATYPPANSSARSPNASGIAMAMSRLAAIIAISSRRTGPESGSSQFVIRVV
jgi:hypothetical protein